MSLRIVMAIFLLSTALTADAGKSGVGAIFGALIGGAVGNAVGKSAASRITIDEALVKVTDQINKQLPISVDKDTRWDSTIAGPGRRFTYHYTIVSMQAAQIDASEFNKVMVPRLRNSVCTSPDLQIFMKNGVVVSYYYQGSDSRFLTKIDVAPRDCV